MRGLKRISANMTGGFVFLAPGLIGFVVFYIWPFIISFWYSFISKPIGGDFVGFKNFAELFQNEAYLLGLRNTAVFLFVSIPLNMFLSLLIAMLIGNSGRYRSLFIMVFLIPLVIPSGSTVFFWKTLFSHFGFINHYLTAAGGEKINWLGSAYARIVITVIFIWKNFGYNIILFSAGLANIPKDCYEAANIDGASPAQCFRRITLPCLVPTTILVLIMSVINSFKVFKEIYLIMGDYPHESVYMLQHFMNNMFYSMSYQRLTAAATVLVVTVAVLTRFLLKWERRTSYD